MLIKYGSKDAIPTSVPINLRNKLIKGNGDTAEEVRKEYLLKTGEIN